jgi:Phasin protein
MPQSKEERNQPLSSFMNSSAWGTHPMMQMPMVAILAEMNGSLLESAAMAQKEWADFLHRRIKEDVAVSRQLMQCHSLADMHQIYSQYFAKAFEQYQQQSTKVVQRGQSMAEHLAETAENGKETARPRH